MPLPKGEIRLRRIYKELKSVAYCASENRKKRVNLLTINKTYILFIVYYLLSAHT